MTSRAGCDAYRSTSRARETWYVPRRRHPLAARPAQPRHLRALRFPSSIGSGFFHRQSARRESTTQSRRGGTGAQPEGSSPRERRPHLVRPLRARARARDILPSVSGSRSRGRLPTAPLPPASHDDPLDVPRVSKTSDGSSVSVRAHQEQGEVSGATSSQGFDVIERRRRRRSLGCPARLPVFTARGSAVPREPPSSGAGSSPKAQALCAAPPTTPPRRSPRARFHA